MSRSWIVTSIIVAVIIFWVLSGVFIPNADPHAQSVPPAENIIPKVRVQVSSAEPMASRLNLQGQTVADRKVTLRAETHGVVEAVLVERGVRVQAGELLVRLAMEDRRAKLVQAKALLDQRQAEYEAAQRLQEGGFQAQTALARAKAEVAAARAAVELAQLEIERVSIHAPIAGIVNQRHLDVGDFVDRGEPVATIVDLDPIRIVGQVSERFLDQIHRGSAGEVRLLDGRTVTGTVSYVGAVAAEPTRTFPVELEIPNPDGRIIEGVTAELALPIRQARAHRVPPSVLTLSDNGALGVKAVSDASRVVFHEVKVLGDSPEGIWLGGLPDEIHLITVGQEYVLSGQRVDAVPVGRLPAAQAR
ncbi:hypothetical protein Tel_07200 [Candidatus Tenderia electrophaga]|jgi:multidrug efflux system membrane fusion protein|uniref:Uncharacterized protein n=1 Tax=Candidatus Tenderia electrophaga TaxID=1748243 RepID=A0A0S2TCZ8_9GAMM|nr:hypothetical protein Tel_07200 [Candidatus Tenderia electrophaga]